MARKRVIYQSEALFVGPSGSGSPTQLSRVQSANYGFDISRTDVNQYGQAGAIDRVLLEAPIVNLDFSYYLNTGQNESALGLVLSTTKSAFSEIMTGTSKSMSNYFILVSPEGTDANLEPTGANSRTIGIGMGGITSYSVEAGVGALPTATVNAEGLNMKFYQGASGFLPEINPINGSGLNDVVFRIPLPTTGDGYSVLRPGDISLNVSGVGINANDLKIQSFSINAEIPRDSIQRLGNKFASFREITYPITLNASVEAIVGDMGDPTQTLGTGSMALTDLICGDSAYTLIFALGAPSTNCDNDYTPYALKYTIKGARLDSQSFSSSIGDNKTVSLQFSAPIGGPSDTLNNLFITNNVN